MTAPTQSAAVLDSHSAVAAVPRRSALDRLLLWAGDHLNPILIKETRQALKSRQFLVTFALLLICGWAWTILGVAWIGPEIHYGAQGREMFAGYYFILAFPLLVIVPFSAFRSLTVEQEERTYELLSITTLGPRQIVSGKLGSAVLQMVVYLSALTPCLAFTYMLRGIDFPTILVILFYTVLASLALALVGLLLGTLTSQKHWQVVLSVVMIAGLLLALGVSYSVAMRVLSGPGVPVASVEFWQANAGFLTGYCGYFLLLFYAAAAQLTFASDNRSTRLRVTMLAQQLLFTGWMLWVWLGPASGENEVLLVFLSFVALHWFVMGALMTGESPELSPRVKRRLPQSFLGRMFLTWFNPGPGTGYVFAIAGMLAALALVLAAEPLQEALRLPVPVAPQAASSRLAFATISAFGVLAASYLTIYLGVGLLLIRLLRRVTRTTVVASLLIQVLLVLLGILVPTVVQWMSPDLRGASYSLLHITNPFWSAGQAVDRGSVSADTWTLLTIVPPIALIVFGLNLPGVARELRHVRIARPKRVAQEDAQLRALRSPPQPIRISPWDEVLPGQEDESP